jgi:hypothetical protein
VPGGDELSAGGRSETWDVVIMDQLDPLRSAIIERLGIAGAQQHPDIAAGTRVAHSRPDQHRSMINLS